MTRATQSILAIFIVTLVASTPDARAACTCAYEDGLLTKSEIEIDGLMGDWADAIADGDNVSCDPIDATDRDFPVQSTGRNLESVVETEDDDYFYMWTQRVGSANNTQNFIYYADTSLDGIMQAGEPVVVARWQGNTGAVDLILYQYDDLGSGGDLMVDGGGWADGHSLPGDLIFVKNFPANSARGATAGAEDGVQMEWRVPWADLGLAPGGSLRWHVASTNSNPAAAGLGAQIDDNLGGCGGMCSGTNEVAGISITGQGTSEIGSVFYSAYQLSNDGNIEDTFELTSASTGDWAPVGVTFYQDLGTVGQYDSGIDLPLTDTGDDATVDTGALPAGATFDLLVAIQKPAAPTTGTATVTSTATSSFVPECAPPATLPFSEDMVDVITILETDLAVTKTDGVTEARAGFDVTFTLTVTNNGPDDAVDAAVVDTLNPAFFDVANVSWTCAITTPGSGADNCDDPGPTTGNLNTTVELSDGAVATFTVTAPVLSSATGTLSNTVTATASDVDPTSGNDSATDDDTVLLPPLQIVKRAYRLDGQAIPDGAVVAKGTRFKFLLYINNDGPFAADVSMQDVLDPGFEYVTGSMLYDAGLTPCASTACTGPEEDAIFAAANGGTVGTDGVDLLDPVSFVSDVIDIGDTNQANAQLDVPAERIWAVVFTVTMQ